MSSYYPIDGLNQSETIITNILYKKKWNITCVYTIQTHSNKQIHRQTYSVKRQNKIKRAGQHETLNIIEFLDFSMDINTLASSVIII